MKQIKVKNIKKLIRSYKLAHKKFRLRSTTMTKRLITGEKTYKNYPLNTLLSCEKKLIRSVNKYNLTIDQPKVNRSRITYMREGFINNGVLHNELFEIDLNRAYWEFAYRSKEQIISKEIYLNGMNLDLNGNEIPKILNKNGECINHVSKKSVLIALGHLAKVTTDVEFNGNYFERPTFIHPPTENSFFKCSQETDSLVKILSVLAGKNFLFFWCDAVFVQGIKTKDLLCNYLANEIGFKFKVMDLLRIERTNSYINVWDKYHLKNGKPEARPFIFRSMSPTDLYRLKNPVINYKDLERSFFK